ncbi:MAG: PAS domain S-box protein, partial [Actinomycetes bacterium]
MTGLLWVEGVGTALVSGAELVAADAAGAGLGVVVQDSSGVIVAANDVGGELLGLSWDQLVGRTSRDSRWSAVSVQGVALTGDQHPAMRTLATGEPVDDFLMGVLIPAGSDAGRIQWLSISAYPVGTPVVGVVTVFTDVSDPSLAQGPDRMLAAVQGVAAAEQRFASMFYTNAAMMMLIDPDNGQIVDANQAAADFYGYPAEQLRSMLISEINMLPDEQVARLRAQVVAGERTSAVFPHRLASGQIRSVLAQSSPIVHHGRTVLFSIGRDVTEREQVEIQLRQATAVFDNTLEAVIITGAAGIVQQVNRAFTTITGWDSTQVIGLSAQSLGGPATTTETRDRIRSAIQDGTAFSGEFSVRHADATQSPVLISISPIPSRMGEVTGFVWVMTDITDRVRAEQELADTAQQYKMLAENVTDVVLFASPQWKLVWASASARDVLGYDPTAMVGADVTNLIHPDDVPLLMSARVAVDEGKESKVTYELRARTATGDYRWLSVVSGPALDANGVNIGRISALRDIHDQVLARQALAVTASELADSERRYRWLAENASDVVFHIDADSLIRWASPSVARVLGWTPEQLVGRAV